MKLNLMHALTDIRHVVYRDIPAEKDVSLFPTISIRSARNKGIAGK
jgi:hypothetical protein